MNNDFKQALLHYFADDSAEVVDHFFYNCAQSLIAAHKSGRPIIAPMRFASIPLDQTN
jgi:hypothetical protein